MNIEQLYSMHKKVQSESTGTPEEFAAKYNIKIRQLQNWLGELKFYGAIIKYSHKRRTYFYVKDFDFFGKLGANLLFDKRNKKILLEFLEDFLEKKRKKADSE